MQSSRKNLIIIGLVVILAATNVAFAVLYMTKNVSISGGIATVGAIEVYEEDGVTPLTSYDFPLFTPGVVQILHLVIFVNNTGNVPVYVDWNISSSSIPWIADETGYQHSEDSISQYGLWMINPYTLDNWTPNDYVTPEAYYIGVGEGLLWRVDLVYSGIPKAPETFTLVMSFYA